MKSISLKDDLTGNESDKDREENVVLEPYCKCPLGFHGQFCEKAVDVQVNDNFNFWIFLRLSMYFELKSSHPVLISILL